MNPTASSLEAAAMCPASAVLPRSNTTSSYAADGTARHEYVRRILPPVSMPPKDALTFVPKSLRAQCAAIDPADLTRGLSSGVRAEVSYAYHVDTNEVRELGVGLGRAYPDLGARWLVGTLDLEGQMLDDVWSVKDLKTGHLDVTPAADNFQIRFFGRILWLLHGEPVAGEIVKMTSDGGVYVESSADYDPLALDSFGDRLVRLVDGVEEARDLLRAGRQLPIAEGPWCRWCPAFSSCPAKQGLVRRLVPELDALGDVVAEMSTLDAGKAWVAYKAAKACVDRIGEVLKDRVRREPLPIGYGKVAKLIRFDRASFDAAAAVVLLRELGATPDQVEGLRRATPVEQIREGKA